MNTENIAELAKTYAEMYEPRYRKAAAQAFADGMKKMQDIINEERNGEHD